jgi:Kef-type K+ transport system membrane component KefB
VPLLANVPPLLSDIGVAILVAAALAFVARALKQPLLLAYVAAGALLGPNVGFRVVTDPDSVEAISSLGLILLLYIIGLEIDVKALRRAGRTVVLAGVLQVPLNFALCLVVPIVLEATGLVGTLGPYGRLYLGFALSLSSTLVVVKVLYDKSELDTLPGRITLGVLVLQDLWSILFLAVQPSLTHPEPGPLLRALGLGVALVVGAFAAARYVLPPIFRGAARSPELMVLGAVAWCFLVAGLASIAGLSAEMGALTAGLAMSYLPYKADVVAKVTTVRDFFLTLFFVSLGLKVAAPTWALAGTAVAVAVFLLLSRFAVMVPLLRLLKAGDRAALVTSMNLWPASEFALVLTAIGLKLHHVESGVLDVVLFTMILSSVAGTYLILASHPVYLRIRGWFAPRPEPAGAQGEGAHGTHAGEHPVVLLGFHRIASALLHDVEAKRPELLPRLLVIDFNPVVLEGLRRRGVACTYGDLGNPDTLHHAGIHGAKVVVCTIPDTLLKGTSNARLVAHVRTLCPDARILATAESPAAEKALREAGVAAVLVPQRAAASSTLADVVALLEDRPPPSGIDLGPRQEILG